MSPSPHATAALTFSSDSYTTRRAKLMGRQAAGEGFLRAFLASETADRVQMLLLNAQDAPAARQSLKDAGWAGAVHTVAPEAVGELAASGVLYLPSPGIGELAWRRARVGERAYSLCGVTHTTASHAVMSGLTDLLTQPVRPWDALICTSNAVRETARRLLEQQADYLRWRLGATRFELPQLPVIPLGVHVGDYQFSPAQRAAARESLGVAEGDTVLLFLGRLSFHAKAHPAAMLQMMERAARARPGRRLHLIQCGWCANEHIEQAFDEAQRVLAPHVTHHRLDGRLPDARHQAWAAADVFCSLSDNIQETFGLTPIEAMAAGLPVLVSDWDGYKDTVRDGVDGYRIRTLTPPPGDGEELALRYDTGADSYDLYCGKSCELVAVDVDQATQRLLALLDDPALARRLGEAGRARARHVYDWAVVMARYRELWARLNEERQHASDWAGPLPLHTPVDRQDPFTLFSMYPTQHLDETLAVRLARPLPLAEYEAMRALACHRFAGTAIPPAASVAPLLERLGNGQPQRVGALIAALAPGQPAQAMTLRRALVWLAKAGWLLW
ncbi:glycosyltransferase family 4 protein [Ideonella livida]|uniref:Glycosyltransferase family 4 protein n=1 Tax=Ideonella livida TaxID=2707176 RepID=A0A7C9PFW8_9BURK|nr:glycosyltransferase family 4 protein [Ideonella livida]NDY90855.1 glycosyltransferase family 4 protein [Ideonella livida]